MGKDPNLEKIRGIFPPIATPLTEDREFDEEGMRRLVKYLLDGGVHGIFVLGSTGEFPFFTLEEKKRIARIVVDEVKGRVPVMAGASDSGTKRVVRNVKALESTGADCVVVTPPYYYEHSQEEIVTHYRKVLEESNLPIFIYNNIRNNVNILPSTVLALAKDERIIGIKDSSGNFNQFQELVRSFKGNEGFKVFQGEEPYLAASILLGGDGAILTFSNAAPKLCVNTYEAALRGDVERAVKLQSNLTDLLNLSLDLGPIPALKTALHLMGVCGPRAGDPFKALTEPEVDQIRGLLKRMGLARPKTAVVR